MLTPKGRGSLSEALFEGFRTSPKTWDSVCGIAPDSSADAHIALWGLYELHYRGFDDTDDALEWHPELIGLRARLERDFERELRRRTPQYNIDGPFAEGFFDLVSQHKGPSTAAFIQRDADLEQTLEILRMRSIYRLKEADPTTWLIPRLSAVPKAALVELQYDEYGGGDPRRLHAELFARGLEACGLRSEYGAYIDDASLEVLEENNALSMFALNRRLRGASLGHLAAFEATSSLPSRQITQGLSRLGLPQEMIDYYAEHIEADAVHEQLAVRTICGALLAEEPALLPDILFGASVCLDLEDRFAYSVLQAAS